MKHRKGYSLILTIFVVLAFCFLLPDREYAQIGTFERSSVSPEDYEMITETDLYCSFYMLEEGKKMPELQIIGAERENEKGMLSDADVIYVNKGELDGLEIGQLFLVVGLREKLGEFGIVTDRNARARIVRLEENVGVAKLEKTCNPVWVGDLLLPFEEEEGEIGQDMGFEYLDPSAGIKGKIIYLRDDTRIGGAGQWGLIDLGRRHCVQIGDQLTVFKRARPDLPREAIASLIIIDDRGASATVKILSGRDAVEIGDEVQLKTVRE